MITRFAPSPTGFLHRGHALSAITVFRRAQAARGRFLLRIEDIDTVRCRPQFSEAIIEDLSWLGLRWEEPVRRQSQHLGLYREAIDKLADMDLLYPCYCTRRELEEHRRRHGVTEGPDGPLYPGLCRHLSARERAAREQEGTPVALRLNMARAVELAGPLPDWNDELHGMQPCTPEIHGDIILARKDIGTSYHIAVVVDDHIQSVSHVIRGMDLFAATHIHILLQHLLGYGTPLYHHHALLLDDSGDKLAKRRGSTSLRDLRASGVTAEGLWAEAQGAF